MARRAQNVTITILTPECDKLSKAQPQSQAIGEFLEWLSVQEIALCEFDRKHDRYYPDGVSIETRLAEYFGIDLAKVERERRAILGGLQAAHSATEG